MANLETQILDDVIVSSRRKMLALGGTALAGALLGGTKAADAQAAATYTDADILNFALNLEYLEANFYYLAAFGTTIDKPNAASMAAGQPMAYALSGVVSTGSTNPAAGGAVVTKAGGPASCQVPTTTAANPQLTQGQIIAYSAYAAETAIEEGKHVGFLYKNLGASAVAQPPLDLYNSFNGLAMLAGIGPSFDPFASLANFLVGAYIFEDVGVTAYHGAAPLLTQTATGKGYLQAAAGILAVEAYHAGLVRTAINALDPNNTLGLQGYTTAISKVRANAAQAVATASPSSVAATAAFDATPDDNGLANISVSLAGAAAVPATAIVDAPTLASSAVPVPSVVAYARTTTQVLNIVTAGGALNGSTIVSPAKGAFFPSGMNGLFK